jgi:hypothetical protein
VAGERTLVAVWLVWAANRTSTIQSGRLVLVAPQCEKAQAKREWHSSFHQQARLQERPSLQLVRTLCHADTLVESLRRDNTRLRSLASYELVLE